MLRFIVEHHAHVVHVAVQGIAGTWIQPLVRTEQNRTNQNKTAQNKAVQRRGDQNGAEQIQSSNRCRAATDAEQQQMHVGIGGYISRSWGEYKCG